MDYLVQKGWIYHDINDDGLMKRGRVTVITDFGGCTKRKMNKDGKVTFLPKRMGTPFTFSSWEMSRLDGGFEKDETAFTRLRPTSVPAVQLSHLSWFSLMRYADICDPIISAMIGEAVFSRHPVSNGNHLCVAAKRLFLERYHHAGCGDEEREYKEIKERRQEFYQKMVSPRVQEDLAGTLEWEYFQSLRPYISYPGADQYQYWETQINESFEHTWNKYKKDFVRLEKVTGAERRFDGLKRLEAEEAPERSESDRSQRQNWRNEQCCRPRCLIM